jgi:hydrogen cyanide synthase HcnC
MMRGADIVVVGGGVIGGAVAYYAAARGLSVTLVDQPKRGRATSASAGGLWPIGESVGLGCGVIFHRARAESGTQSVDNSDNPGMLPACFFDFAIRSNAMFPALVDEIRATVGVDVEWDRTSLMFLMYDEADVAFARSVEASRCGGAQRTQWLTAEEVARCEPAVTHAILGALVFHGDDQINPYRLAEGLRSGARARGARLLTHSAVTGLRTEAGRVTAVEVGDETIPCAVVVNAAGAWAPRIGRMVGLEIPVRPVRGQIVGTESLPKLVNACLSTADCYLLQKRHGEVIIGSTTEEVGFETRVTPSALQTLSAGAVRAVPALETVRVKRTWSGLRPGTPDELPILGPVDGLDGYLNACGHFRTGILNAPLTGLLIAELVAGASTTTIPIDPFLLARFQTG